MTFKTFQYIRGVVGFAAVVLSHVTTENTDAEKWRTMVNPKNT